MSDQATNPLGIIWGVKNIAALIGRSERQTLFALTNGELPGQKVNNRWCVSRAKLEAFFNGDETGKAA